MNIRLNFFLVLLSISFLPVSASAQNNTSIQVLSATVKDKPVGGAEVIFQKNGEKSVNTTTNLLGKSSVYVPFNTNDNSSLLIIKAKGYSTLVVKCPCNGLTYALSETMTQLDGMRIVLSWGDHPIDMDSHLVFDRNHISFNHKRGENAWLDVDSRQGYGPETITIGERNTGNDYIYAVHTYHDENKFKKNHYNIKAKAQVYVGNSLVRTYYFQPGEPGTLRYLFGINKQGEIYDLNKIVRGVSGEEGVIRELNSSLSSSYVLNTNSITISAPRPNSSPRASMGRGAGITIGSYTRASSGDISKAKLINQKGEKAYHRKELDAAIRLYHQAIELDPEYSQAYSNLGLAYQKSKRIAEALWANRKAIVLAKGKKKHIVRASSYYNIARIYESHNMLKKALQNYVFAEQQRPRKAYKKAIKRIKDKINQADT